LEEPETNLHPNWQSILAELFAFQISIGLRFVIETHSEYMIRKIQTLIAKNECNKDDVIVHYFNSEQERNQYDLNTTREIKININGTLSESFGSGFFDEAGKLSLELLSFNSIRKN
jgi:predicted ATPase